MSAGATHRVTQPMRVVVARRDRRRHEPSPPSSHSANGEPRQRHAARGEVRALPPIRCVLSADDAADLSGVTPGACAAGCRHRARRRSRGDQAAIVRRKARAARALRGAPSRRLVRLHSCVCEDR